MLAQYLLDLVSFWGSVVFRIIDMSCIRMNGLQLNGVRVVMSDGEDCVEEEIGGYGGQPGM